MAFLPGLLGAAEEQLDARDGARSPGADMVTKGPLLGPWEGGGRYL